MDEFSTEDEQVEELRKWWSENWMQVIGGLAVGLALIFGWRAWSNAQLAMAERASMQYELLQGAVDSNDSASAEGILSVLEADYSGTPYLQQGYLALARMRVDNGDLDGAADMLESALDAKDAELARVARLRLARIRLQQGDSDAALQLLDGQADGPFAGLYADARGDALVAAGRNLEARDAYEAALALDSNNLVDRDYIEMKLAMLKTSPDGEDG